MQFPGRSCLLVVVFALLIMIPGPGWSQQRQDQQTGSTQQPSMTSEKTPLDTMPLGDNIFLISGNSTNVIAVSDDKSVLLIGSGTPDRTTELARAVYQIAQRPVTTLINMDHHPHQAGGNPYFSSFGVQIIAQENTRKHIAEEYRAALKQYVANNHSSFKVAVSPWSAAVEDEASARYGLRGIPNIAFNDTMTFNLHTEEVRLCYYGAAHTDGDSVVYLADANIVVLGDIFPGDGYPWIDVLSGGSLAGLIGTVAHVLNTITDETRIVPARGAVLHKPELQKYRDMLMTVEERVKALVDSGASAAEVVAAGPTRDLDAEWGGGLVSGEEFTSSVVNLIAPTR
jgi:glyoxylase-like metal-dependent hydrolase (beta-lactamase superfamily II)